MEERAQAKKGRCGSGEMGLDPQISAGPAGLSRAAHTPMSSQTPAGLFLQPLTFKNRVCVQRILLDD